MKVEKPRDEPVLLVKWYEYTRWVLDRVDGFPKNQRFVLGTRLADAVVLVVELLAEAAYAGRGRKNKLLSEANRKIEVTRWLVRLAADQNPVSQRRFVHRPSPSGSDPRIRPSRAASPSGASGSVSGTSSARWRNAP